MLSTSTNVRAACLILLPSIAFLPYHAQCKELKRNLGALLREKVKEFGDPLFVVSPLTRALQTFVESCPWPERIPGHSAVQADAAGGGDSGASTSAPPPPPLRVEVTPAISEFVISAGDVGRPPAALAKEFPVVGGMGWALGVCKLLVLPSFWARHRLALLATLACFG